MTMTRIYGLVDPRCGTVRYVGQTRYRLTERLVNHISQARGEAKRRARISRKSQWILQLLSLQVRPKIVSLQEWNCEKTVREATGAERKWIAAFPDCLNASVPLPCPMQALLVHKDDLAILDLLITPEEPTRSSVVRRLLKEAVEAMKVTTGKRAL